MCGIVGYVGRREAVPFLIDGLKRLEYRGYDSAGVAAVTGGRLEVAKTVGRLARLEELLAAGTPEGRIGIGHTRWATHGRPSDRNAHPHLDCGERFAVVHNGIIENYMELREWLQERGHIFRSETDTEVVPHLIEEFYQGETLAAFRAALARLEGAFALVLLDREHADRLYVARKASPLIVGLGEGENYVASDIPAVLPLTRRVYILEDGEMAVVTAAKVELTEFTGAPRAKEVFIVQWDAVQAERGGYEDFMLKEIHEQPRAFRDTMAGRIDRTAGRIVLNEIRLTPEEIGKLEKICIVACGSAYHAGVAGKYILERLTRLPVEVDLASEFRYRDPIVDRDTLAIIISQSGETADTLAALREAKQRGAHTVGITNVIGSTVARESDDLLLTLAGPEIAVATTKAYNTQVLSLCLLGLYLAEARGTVTEADRRRLVEGLLALPDQLAKVLTTEQKIKEFALKFKHCEDVFFIGRGVDFAVSLESALKLKEISYIHAEAYAAGELKHGALALIVEGVPVFALITQPDLYEKTISNIKEVKARDATVVALAVTGDHETEKSVDYVLHIPRCEPLLAPMLAVVPFQLLAYHAAKARGCDVDKPRNLAKSVTVE